MCSRSSPSRGSKKKKKNKLSRTEVRKSVVEMDGTAGGIRRSESESRFCHWTWDVPGQSKLPHLVNKAPLICLACLSNSCPISHHAYQPLPTLCCFFSLCPYSHLSSCLLAFRHIICLTHHRYHGPEAAGRPSSLHPAHLLHSAPSRGITCVLPALPLNSQLLQGSSHGWLISVPGLGYTLVEVLFN